MRASHYVLKHGLCHVAIVGILGLATSSAALGADGKSDTPGREVRSAESPKPAAGSIEEQLQRQTLILQQMQEALARQQAEIERLRGEVNDMRNAAAAVASESAAEEVADTAAPVAPVVVAAPIGRPTVDPSPPQKPDDDVANRLGALEQRWGKLRLSGDFRLRYEGLFNQGFDAAADVDPRSRFRIRARAQLTGEINKHFDWGLRLATGNFNEPISTNQTFTDFYNRKPFGLDRAYIHFNSRTKPVELDLYAGKFDYTWRRTPLTFDADLQPEGLSQSVRFDTGDGSPLRAVKVVTWQLPYLERSVGADAVIYGGQIQTDWKWSDDWSTNLSGTFHDFEKVDVLAAAVNVPSTVVNAGFNYGTTNSVFTNPVTGRPEFRSEFRIVDVLAELRYTGFGEKDARGETRWPLTIRADWVHNTSAFDNNRDGGLATAELGRASQQGDWQFEYSFYKSERDAFPSVFGESDVVTTNGVAHWVRGSYMINRQVMLDVRHMLQKRLITAGPEDRWLNRLQFDVHYRF